MQQCAGGDVLRKSDLSARDEGQAGHDKIPDVHFFGLAHIAWLIGVALTSALSAFLLRHRWMSDKVVRIVFPLIIAAGEFQRHFHDGIWFPGNIPIQLCNLTAWVAVWACLTLSPTATEIIYFLGLSGAGLALLSPDMGSDWHPRFFVTHGSIVVVSIALVYGRIAILRAGAVWRVWVIGVGYLVLIWLFNSRFGTNYAYIGRKPATSSLLDLMGPYPVYIFVMAFFALGLFWLLWLPVPGRRVTKKPSAQLALPSEVEV